MSTYLTLLAALTVTALPTHSTSTALGAVLCTIYFLTSVDLTLALCEIKKLIQLALKLFHL